jgi:hypothetical protein
MEPAPIRRGFPSIPPLPRSPVTWRRSGSDTVDAADNRPIVSREEYEQARANVIAEALVADNAPDGIQTILARIRRLRWNEWVEYQGERWGIPAFYAGFHRENDCLGVMEVVSKWFTNFDGPYLRAHCVEIVRCHKCGAIFGKPEIIA